MSIKQNVLKRLESAFFSEINKLDPYSPVYEQAQKHSRELLAYIRLTLNSHTNEVMAIHSLNPRLFDMLGSSTKQQIKYYRENPHSDHSVKSALAFKMLIGS